MVALRKAYHLWLYIGLLSVILLIPQPSSAQYDQLNFFDLRIDGHPFRNQVNTLFQDSFGFLWIGTNTGLYQYDGYRLKAYQYDVFDPTSIPNNSINSIVEDEYHNLWLGSESYLIRFDRQREEFNRFYKNQTSVCLGKGSDGTIWANLRKVGLAKITPTAKADELSFETYFNYTGDGIIRENKVLNAICEDDFGRQWLATPGGLYLLDARNKLQATNIQEPVTAILRAPNQAFWVSTDRRLYKLEYSRKNAHLTMLEKYDIFPAHTPGKQRILSLLLDQNQQLWIGTNDGLYRGLRRSNTYLFEEAPRQLAPNGNSYRDQINALTLDQFGNLWIGSHKGVKKLISRSTVFRFNPLEILQQGLKNEKVISPMLDHRQQLWFGLSSGGLYRLDLRTRRCRKIINSSRRLQAINYNFSRDGLLVGLGPDLFEVRSLSDEQPEIQMIRQYDKTVQDIVPINSRETWVGLWSGGLRIINSQESPDAFRTELLTATQGNNISVMLLDSKRNVWIGTRGEGLYRVDLKNQLFEHYLPSRGSGLSSDAFLSIHEDQDHHIWMGTRGGGLIRYHETDNRFTSYSRQDGLLVNTIAGIEEDIDGHLWLSTTEGLVRFEKSNGRILNFTAEDGILESQFAFNSSTAGPDGEVLFFGTNDGFYEVYPEAFHQTDVLSRTVITSFNLLDHQTDQTSSFQEQLVGLVTDSASITLPYHQNDFSLEFSSLDLTAPNKNKFAYRLDGVNENWIIAGRNIRNASYYDLRHGRYTFRVKSSNSDGLWNEQATILQITITPPFWLTGWAYLIYTLLALGFLAVVLIASRKWYQLKKNLLRETVSREKDNQYHRMRMVFFTDISHELRTPLTLILSSIEQLIKGKRKSLKPATGQRIYNNALKMKQLINQIMDIRKHSEGEFKLKVSQRDAVLYLKMLTSTFTDLAKLQQIELKFHAGESQLKSWFDPLIVEKIVSNLLSNALKFTPSSGRIVLSVQAEQLSAGAAAEKALQAGHYLKITVEDNGIGMTKEDLKHIFNRYYQASNNIQVNSGSSTGIGMELVYKLVKLHHGMITAESEIDTFTRFTIYLPVAADRYTPEERADAEDADNMPGFAPSPALPELVHASPEATPAAPNKSPSEKAQILLVEDNPELRQMMREILARNYRVLEAEHGGIGFETALKEQPQIIISDILMPEVDGLSLLQRLKANARTRHIHVFLLTAKVNDEVKKESIQLGAEDFIEKPFSMDFLEWKVANALKTRKILEDKYSKKITAETSAIELESPDEKLIQDLVQLIEIHLEDPKLSVAFLASQVGMSRANLYRKLQKTLGETPVGFIRKLKLKRARQILAMKKFYIAEVAYMCGFKSQRYFSKCFVKAYGCTPTQYVAGLQKEDEVIKEVNFESTDLH